LLVTVALGLAGEPDRAAAQPRHPAVRLGDLRAGLDVSRSRAGARESGLTLQASDQSSASAWSSICLTSRVMRFVP
jgi:hypothetical protein